MKHVLPRLESPGGASEGRWASIIGAEDAALGHDGAAPATETGTTERESASLAATRARSAVRLLVAAGLLSMALRPAPDGSSGRVSPSTEAGPPVTCLPSHACNPSCLARTRARKAASRSAAGVATPGGAKLGATCAWPSCSGARSAAPETGCTPERKAKRRSAAPLTARLHRLLAVQLKLRGVRTFKVRGVRVRGAAG